MGALFDGSQGMLKNQGGFPREKKNGSFPQGSFPFPQQAVEKRRHRFELILVLISFTLSAKAGSFFIFFSTCWME